MGRSLALLNAVIAGAVFSETHACRCMLRGMQLGIEARRWRPQLQALKIAFLLNGSSPAGVVGRWLVYRTAWLCGQVIQRQLSSANKLPDLRYCLMPKKPRSAEGSSSWARASELRFAGTRSATCRCLRHDRLQERQLCLSGTGCRAQAVATEFLWWCWGMPIGALGAL